MRGRGAVVAATGACMVVGVLAGCSGDDADVTLRIEPGPNSVLSAVVTVRAEEPVRVGLTATADGHEVTIPPPAEAATEYELALVGLRPDTEYEVSADGADDVDFTTGSLPDDFPPLELDVDAGRAEPGLTLLSLKPWREPEGDPPMASPAPGGYLAAVDHEGYVVWYHPTELGVLDARQLPNGNFLFTYDEVAVREVDVLGRPVREVAGRIAHDVTPTDFFGRPRVSDAAVRMATDSAHHDASITEHGTLLLLSTELREVSGPPQCGEEGDEATYLAIGDVVVELDPDTGETLGEWRLFDVFDPFERPGSELCVTGSPFAPPNFFYAGDGSIDVRDWTHGNSVVIDEERNALVVSLRHLSAVVALRYADDEDGPAGELLWELGPDGDLELDGTPPSYQHAAEVLDDGSILLYDNGNDRAGGTPYSRGVIFAVDDDARRATQVWEHVDEDADGRRVFTAFLGDADALPNGNVLLTHGAIDDGEGGLSARIVEVDRDSGDVVFDLAVGDDDEHWSVYRSERLATLTPR